MDKSFVFIIFLAVAIILVVFNYLHKRHIHYNPDDLRKSVQKILEKQNGKPINKADFLIELKRAYRCSHKEANYLLGKAREHNFVTLVDSEVRLKA